MTFDELFDEQARKRKLAITEEAISKVSATEIVFFDEDECNKIRDFHQSLLRMAMERNDSNEVGFLINLMDWSYISVLGGETGISVRNNLMAKELLITAPARSLLFLHNHPKNSVFSERDLNSFFTADAIVMMTVVCNNGRTYYLIKRKDFDSAAALKYYDDLFDNENISSAVKEFLRTCGKVGLSFYYGGI